MAARIGVSKSTLHRWESGAAVPLSWAAPLDQTFGTAGWLLYAANRLHVDDWCPAADTDDARVSHTHRWPAVYSGVVWVVLKLAVVPPRSASAGLSVTLSRGGHDLASQRFRGLERVVVCIRKTAQNDGVAAPMTVRTSVPTFALFGAGAVRGNWLVEL